MAKLLQSSILYSDPELHLRFKNAVKQKNKNDISKTQLLNLNLFLSELNNLSISLNTDDGKVKKWNKKKVKRITAVLSELFLIILD